MKTVKFAAIFMGSDFSPQKHHLYFKDTCNETHFWGVKDLSEACLLAKELKDKGFECIELCGAFGKAGAKAVMEAAGPEIAVGYSIHFPEQDPLFAQLFG